MKAAQVGATEAGNNWIGFVIHHAPGLMFAVLPTVAMAKRASRGRLDPLIADSPALRQRVSPACARDARNSMLSKELPGGILVLTGANSATDLRSMPARYHQGADGVADFQIADLAANCRNGSCDLKSRQIACVRQHGIATLPMQHTRGVHASRRDADHHFTGAGPGDVALFRQEDRRRPWLGNGNACHLTSNCSGRERLLDFTNGFGTSSGGRFEKLVDR